VTQKQDHKYGKWLSEGPRWKFSENNKVETFKSQAEKLRTDPFGL